MAIRLDAKAIPSHLLAMLTKQMTFVGQRRSAADKPIPFYRFSGDRLYMPFMTGRIRGMDEEVDGKFEIDQYIIKDNLPYHPRIVMDYIGSLRPKQLSIFDEAVASLERTNSAQLTLPTGMGKTSLSVRLIGHLGLITLVLLPKDILIEQWRATILRDLNVEHEDIAVVGGKNRLPITSRTKIVICLVKSFHNIPTMFRDKIGVMVVDEVHTFINTTGAIAMIGLCPDYLIGCSATPERSDGGHRMLRHFFGNDDIFRDVDVNFDVVRVWTGIKPKRPLNLRGELDFVKFQTGLMENPKRNEIIARLVQYEQRRPIIILVAFKKHVEIICELLKERDISVDTLYGNKSSYTSCDVLVGTIPKVGTGFDEAKCCSNYQGVPSSCLILGTSIKSTPCFVQAIGRVARVDNPTIYHIIDDDPTLDRHWKQNFSWYKKHDCPVKNIEIGAPLVKAARTRTVR